MSFISLPATLNDRSPCLACQEAGHSRLTCPNDRPLPGQPSHRATGRQPIGPCPCRGLPAGSVLGPQHSASQVGSPLFPTPAANPFLTIMTGQTTTPNRQQQALEAARTRYGNLPSHVLTDLANIMMQEFVANDANQAIADLQAAGRPVPPALQALTTAQPQQTTITTPTGAVPPGPPPSWKPITDRPIGSALITGTITNASTPIRFNLTLASVSQIVTGVTTNRIRLDHLRFSFQSTNQNATTIAMVAGIFRSITPPTFADINTFRSQALSVSQVVGRDTSGAVDLQPPSPIEIDGTVNDIWLVLAIRVGGTAQNTTTIANVDLSVGISFL